MIGGNPISEDDKRRLVIALDLGSESSVAWFQLEDKNGISQATMVDLQFFARALAPVPKKLKEGAHDSKRLRTRFILNQHFEGRVFKEGDTPNRQKESGVSGQKELLLPGGRQLALDCREFKLVKRVVAYKKKRADSPHSNLSAYGSPESAPIKFFYDKMNLPVRSECVPNSKLAFQFYRARGLPQVTFERLTDSSGKANVERDVTSIELLKYQICLALECLIRQLPELRFGPDNATIPWEQITVLLTVPNTYSPVHRRIVKSLVSEEFGCDVQTRSESDAIAFYYILRLRTEAGRGARPDSRRSDGREVRTDRRWNLYLTIDIGRGTTDVSLLGFKMSKDPETGALVPTVEYFARTGRVSGGAQLTYWIVQFLENCLCDLVPGFKPWLTTALNLKFQRETEFLALLECLEQWAEGVKASWQDDDGIVRLKDFDVAEDVKKDAIEGLMYGFESTASRDGEDKEGPRAKGFFEYFINSTPKVFDEAQKSEKQKRRDVPDVRESPALKSLRKHFQELQRKVNDHVKENTDAVLCEIVREHARNRSAARTEDAEDAPIIIEDEEEAPIIRNAEDALRVLGGDAPQDDPHVCTHIILAGRGSLFQPIRSRLERASKKVGFADKIISEEEVRTGKIKRPPAKGIWDWVKGLMNDSGVIIDRFGKIRANCLVELDSENRKNICALGTLLCYRQEPKFRNPDYVHGEFIVKPELGDVVRIDMNDLNSGKVFDVKITNDGEPAASPGTLYYFPGMRDFDAETYDWENEREHEICGFRNTERLKFKIDAGEVAIWYGEHKEKSITVEDLGLYGRQKVPPEIAWPVLLRDPANEDELK